MAVIEGWEMFTRNGEGDSFIMGGWKIFKVSLHSWQMGASPLFYEDSPYIA